MSKEILLKTIFQDCNNLFKLNHFSDALSLVSKYTNQEPVLIKNFLFLNLVGFINLNLKDWDTAITNFKKAIEINKNYIPAYLNLAIALYDKGDLEESFKNLSKILKIDPNNKRAEENNPFSRANNELQKINLDLDLLKKIDDLFIDNLLSKSRLITSNFLTDLNFREHQLFIHNRRDLNCERHMKIFKKFETISKNCFSCFKIIIHIEKVYDLIKLSLLFNNLQLLNNFEMKCRIDFKKKNYRGYVYCDNIDELKFISENLTKILDMNFQNNYKLEKRRGCSEFSEIFHKFKKINSDPDKMFQYKQDWSQNEKIIDKQNYIHGIPIIRNIKKPLKGMTLNYFLIINNWINFSKNLR